MLNRLSTLRGYSQSATRVPHLSGLNVAPWLILVLSALLPLPSLAQIPQPQQGSVQGVPRSLDGSDVPRPIFELHSGFWLNLHHFLYEQARIRDQEEIIRGEGGSLPLPNGTATKARDADSPAWQTAINYYSKNLARRDLQVDQNMIQINNVLADLETCADLSGTSSPTCASGLRPEMVAVLEAAAPVYRKHWWKEQDRQNREWIESVAPLVRRIGGTLADELAVVYHATWPQNPIRVDVVFYAGPFGAYTSLDPTHITVSSSDPRNQGLSAFEILFHEASHPLATAVQDGILNACHERGIPIPRDLWHALLFYTTGEIVRRAVADGRLRVPGESPGTMPAAYTPYAYRNGLYSRGWENYQRLLETYWKPYLDGQTDFNRAISSLVAGL